MASSEKSPSACGVPVCRFVRDEAISPRPRPRRARAVTPTPVSAGSAAEAAAAVAVQAVVGSLAKFAREAPLRTQAASGWNSRGNATVWVVGEVGAGENWTAGGEADRHARARRRTRLQRSRDDCAGGAHVPSRGRVDRAAGRGRLSGPRPRERRGRPGRAARRYGDDRRVVVSGFDRRAAAAPGTNDRQQDRPDGGFAIPPQRAALGSTCRLARRDR